MLSTNFNSTQYPPSQIHLLEQSFNPTNIPSDLQALLPDFSVQFKFEALDMTSLPALMSPGSSVNEFSESVDGREEEEEDDDEDLDEYEIFAAPCQRTNGNNSNANSSNNNNDNKKQYQLEYSEEKAMGFESAFPFSLQSFHNHPHFAFSNASSPMHSEFQQSQMIYSQYTQHLQQQHAFMPEAQQLQTLPLPQQHQQQQQPMYSSNFIQHQQPFIPSLTPLHHTVPTIAVEQVAHPNAYHEPGALDFYFSSLESQRVQQQPPSLLTTLESSIDHLMTPHVPNGSNVGGMPTNGSFAQSPTMSWASIESSRPVSPEYQALSSQTVPLTAGASSCKRSRPTKKHSVPLYRKAKYHASERLHASANIVAAKEEHDNSSTAVEAGDLTRNKRKRRARQTKPKVKPTSFSCDFPDCGKVFSRAYNLTSHMKTHSAERPFLCGACPLAFARRHDRERHVRLHTGEKPYNCQSCGSGFMRNDALHRHQRTCGHTVTALVALLQQNGGSQDGASLESLDTSSVLYQNIFEL